MQRSNRFRKNTEILKKLGFHKFIRLGSIRFDLTVSKKKDNFKSFKLILSYYKADILSSFLMFGKTNMCLSILYLLLYNNRIEKTEKDSKSSENFLKMLILL